MSTANKTAPNKQLAKFKKQLNDQREALLFVLGHLYYAPQDEVAMHTVNLGGDIAIPGDEPEEPETDAPLNQEQTAE